MMQPTRQSQQFKICLLSFLHRCIPIMHPEYLDHTQNA
uniref:Uncharacterized protein n=1 Tax=Rhizophora mucronata TaxID=61149 RepID=A0A2P2JNL5_RHIMU